MHRRVFLAIVLFLVVGSFSILRAASVSLDGLLSNPPFNGPAKPVTIEAESNALLEFRGVLIDRGEALFSLYEVSSRSSVWIGLNEPGHSLVILNYDAIAMQVTVQYQDRTLLLPIKQAKVAALASPDASSTASNLTTANPAPDLASAEVTAQRSAIIEEIRRRRALRQQSLRQNSPASSYRD